MKCVSGHQHERFGSHAGETADVSRCMARGVQEVERAVAEVVDCEEGADLNRLEDRAGRKVKLSDRSSRKVGFKEGEFGLDGNPGRSPAERYPGPTISVTEAGKREGSPRWSKCGWL